MKTRLHAPDFNIAPEKLWLEEYFAFGMVSFFGAMLNFRGASPATTIPSLDV